MELEGKIAIVTGASRGVGKGIAKVFALEGAAVAIAARTEAADKRLPGTIYQTAEEIAAEGGRALPLRCDVSSEEDVRAMVDRTLEEYGRVDILVNNAGGAFSYQKVQDLPPARFDQTIAVNVRGPFLCCQAVLPTMIAQHSGNIINVTSGAAYRFSRRGDTAYGLSKAALDRFSLGLAWEVREHNISVVSVAPGRVKTEGIEMMYRDVALDWDADDWQTPEESARPLVWLARQAAEDFTMRVVQAAEFGKTWP